MSKSKEGKNEKFGLGKDLEAARGRARQAMQPNVEGGINSYTEALRSIDGHLQLKFVPGNCWTRY
jgi:hypothetical protein